MMVKKMKEALNPRAKATADTIIKWILIAGIVFIVVVVLIAAGYTYPCEDDFSFEYGALTQAQEYGSSFLGALHQVWGYAIAMQGTYLANFLFHFVMPYTRWGMPGFHMVMILISVFYIASLEFLVRSFKLRKNTSLAIFLLALVVSFCLSGTENNRELFLWCTGALNYTVEISIGFMSLGLLTRYIKGNEKKCYLIFSAVLAIFASWGCLEVAGYFCALHLLVLAMNFDILRQRKRLLTPFICAFLAAVANCAAPGNFVRMNLEMGEEDLSALIVIKNTVSCIQSENLVIFKSPFFLLACLAAFLMAVILKDFYDGYVISVKQFLIIVSATLLAQIVIAFPVAWGLNSASLSSMRTAGTYEILVRLIYLFLIMSLGMLIKQYGSRTYSIACAAAVLLALIGFFSIEDKKIDLNNAQIPCTVSDIRSGNLVNNYRVREYVLATCANAEPGSDVTLCVPLYETKFTYGMGALDYPENQVNRFISYLFGLDDFIITYK